MLQIAMRQAFLFPKETQLQFIKFGVIDISSVNWWIFQLSSSLEGREEVKTLVDLAMMSAGESDIETDRVSFLHTTALGFAPFIFDLSKDIGFSQLMRLCDSVWKEIKENPTLPKKLVKQIILLFYYS